MTTSSTADGIKEHERALTTLVDGLDVAEINPGKTFNMGAAALYYATQLGWPVFPVHHPVPDDTAPNGLACSCGQDCASPAKHPFTRNGLLDATTDTDTIRGWWERWPLANIAARTGSVESGGIGLDAIDIDGDEGWQTWRQWMQDSPDSVPVMVCEAFTPGNRKRRPGRHRLITACGTTNTTHALPNIDLRGESGYVLVAPSQGITGPRYCWLTAPVVGL